MTASKKQIAMMPSHPGAFLMQEVLEPLELSVTQAAKLLAVRRATLSDLLHEKSSLSAEMALRVEIVFGLDMEQMLQMQAWYDAARMRRSAQGLQLNIEPYQRPEAIS